MKKNTSVFSTNRLCLFSFLLLCSLFISDSAFSRSNWNWRFMKVYYDDSNTGIIMDNKIYDYYFGPWDEHGFLQFCDYEYSTDGEHFAPLLRCEVASQGRIDWTWAVVKDKKADAKIQFVNSFSPEAGSFWLDNEAETTVKVKDLKNIPGYKIFHYANLVVKWVLSPEDVNINYIRVRGKWKVNGLYDCDYINQVYEVFRQGPPDNDFQGTKVQVSKNIETKVIKESDAIVVSGTEPGENIKVYTVTGVEVKSVVTTSDVVKIKLPKNQVYIVSVGQASYKVALYIPYY